MILSHVCEWCESPRMILSPVAERCESPGTALLGRVLVVAAVQGGGGSPAEAGGRATPLSTTSNQ